MKEPSPLTQPSGKITIRQIALEATIDAILSTITLKPIAKTLSRCDIIFGCTDDNAGRASLVAHVYLLANSREAKVFRFPPGDQPKFRLLANQREDGPFRQRFALLRAHV